MLEKFFNSLTKKPAAPVSPAAAPVAAAKPAGVAGPVTAAKPAGVAGPVVTAKPAGVAGPPPAATMPGVVPTSPLGRFVLANAPVVPVKPVVKAPETPAAAARTSDISLYKNLLAGLYDGVLIFDEKGSVIGSNPRAEQYLGYASQDLWGLQCDALVVGINTRMLYKLRTNAEAGRFTVVNGNCRRKDGTTFPAEIAISRIRLLNDGDFIFSIHNVERREKVREQREMSHEAIRSAGTGIVVCNKEGAIEFVNPAFLKILHLDDEQAVLKRLIADFCNSYELVYAMLHAPSTQGIWLGTLKLTNPKGQSCEVLVTSALSQERRGAEPRLVLTMTPLPKTMTPESVG